MRSASTPVLSLGTPLTDADHRLDDQPKSEPTNSCTCLIDSGVRFCPLTWFHGEKVLIVYLFRPGRGISSRSMMRTACFLGPCRDSPGPKTSGEALHCWPRGYARDSPLQAQRTSSVVRTVRLGR